MVGVNSLPGFIMKANIQTVHMLPTNVSSGRRNRLGWFPIQNYMHNQNSLVISSGI